MRKRRNSPKIVFEDQDFLALEKPAGWVVNRAETTKEKTIQDWVERKLPVLDFVETRSGKIENLKFKIERSGIVHRLDKETSGLLLVAKTPVAFENLQEQFKERRVEKHYLALVHGEVKPEQGIIRASIARSPFNRKKFGVFLGGRGAETEYRVIAVRNDDGKWEVSRGWEAWVRKNTPLLNLTPRPSSHFSSPPPILTLLELQPKTGRTHQIRVHLKYLGHPIVGDAKYAGRKQSRQDREWCPRQFLHASFLSFNHPRSGQRMELISPLPRDLERALETFNPIS